MEERAQIVPEFSEGSFRLFYEDTVTEALSIAKRVCGNDEDAKEACQDAYVAVYRYWSSGRLKAAPRALLFRALRRSAVDALRARVRCDLVLLPAQRMEGVDDAESTPRVATRAPVEGRRERHGRELLRHA